MGDLEFVEKEIARLKVMAEEYPAIDDTSEKPHHRHWSDLPGKVRICFTKKFFDNELFYHLSVSHEGMERVDDIIIMALLKMFEAPQTVEEILALYNKSVRHFTWGVINN